MEEQLSRVDFEIGCTASSMEWLDCNMNCLADLWIHLKEEEEVEVVSSIYWAKIQTSTSNRRVNAKEVARKKALECVVEPDFEVGEVAVKKRLKVEAAVESRGWADRWSVVVAAGKGSGLETLMILVLLSSSIP